MGVEVARRPPLKWALPDTSAWITLFSTLKEASLLSIQLPHLGLSPLALMSIFRLSGLVAFQLRSMSKFLLEPVALILKLFLRKNFSASDLLLGRAPSQVTLGSSQSPFCRVILVLKELSVRV